MTLLSKPILSFDKRHLQVHPESLLMPLEGVRQGALASFWDKLTCSHSVQSAGRPETAASVTSAELPICAASLRELHSGVFILRNGMRSDTARRLVYASSGAQKLRAVVAHLRLTVRHVSFRSTRFQMNASQLCFACFHQPGNPMAAFLPDSGSGSHDTHCY